MRKSNIDNVEIVEPPLGELTKKRSTFKRTCFTGCGCLILLLIGAVVAFRFAVGPGPRTLSNVPKNFPNNIPVYDRDNIDRITFISGRYKNRSVEIASIFPKIILSSLLLNLQHSDQPKSTDELTDDVNVSFTQRLWAMLTTPVADSRDTVQIEWRKMDAAPSFVASYYKKELVKKGYAVSEEKDDNKGTYTFSFNQDGVGGAILTQGPEEVRPGTDYAVLTVNFFGTPTSSVR